ncbi:hypothetical protein BR93DRAFT_940266 [Coniochaeta sp. PMI_546]|nr:hypothetical protein BR93DRAFT_940266 [Coniochaeta sp. PMI_546]
MTTSYQHEVFDSLPDVTTAATTVRDEEGEQLIRSAVKDLLLKYSLNDKLGVALVHRHFDLKPDEVMVDYHGVATPWNTALLDHYSGFGSVQPLSWVVVDGTPRPYEFYYSTDTPSDKMCTADLPEDFVTEYESLLTGGGLEGYLGIRALRGQPGNGIEGTMEFTQRYATFTVPYNASSEYKPKGALYRTCWAFRNGKEEPGDCIIQS